MIFSVLHESHLTQSFYLGSVGIIQTCRGIKQSCGWVNWMRKEHLLSIKHVFVVIVVKLNLLFNHYFHQTTNIYISSLRRATLLKFGLSYIGNAVSLFYNGETKEREVDSTLEAFLTPDKEVIIVKISRSRRLTLKNLAAERVCLSLSNRDSLQKLATSTQIPNPCVKALERCIWLILGTATGLINHDKSSLRCKGDIM